MKTLQQTIRLLAVAAVGFGLLAVFFTQLNVVAKAAPADQLDVCATCTYTTIQTAVSAANPDDIIRVAQGTYQDAVTAPGLLTSTVLITKNLTLMGGYSSDFQTHDPSQYPTIIDGQNANKGFYVWGATAHIEGFTIDNAGQQGMLIVANDQQVWGEATIVNNIVKDGATNGIIFYRATGTVMSNTIHQNGDIGVGIAEAEVTVSDNLIAQNQAQGIYATVATVTIDNNRILSNTANGGAGILLETYTQFTVTNNLIQNNHASPDSGGGIAVYGRATGLIANNDLINNSATNGGGIGSYDNGDLVVRHNRILSNTAVNSGGGGIHLNPDAFTIITNTAQLTITHNTIHHNFAAAGAGIQVMNADTKVDISANDVRHNRIAEGEPDYQAGGIELNTVGEAGNIYNNVLIDNDNRAIKANNFPTLWVVNNTIVQGNKDGIELFYWPSTPPEPANATVMNNIIVGQDGCGVQMFNGITLRVDYNLFHDNGTDICATTTVPPHANIFADPLFVDAGGGDYQLQFQSPAIDSGFGGPKVPNADIAGVDRPQGSGVDMGAYEIVVNQIFLPIIVSPLPSGQTTLLDGFVHFGESGFDFSTNTVVAWDSSNADLMAGKGSWSPLINFFLPFNAPPFPDVDTHAGIIQMPQMELDQVSECPESGYSYHWNVPNSGSVYCVRTRDGAHYAIVKVIAIGGDSVSFAWKYQPSGSRLFQ